MDADLTRQLGRSDIVAVDNQDLSTTIAKYRKNRAPATSPRARPDARAPMKADDADRIEMRLDLLESPNSDPNGYERLIGKSDLTSINFLDRGRRAAAAVCRIKIPRADGFAYGTGFLVAARLLMTNNHVIGSRDEASQAEAEFGFEHDVDGVLTDPVQFNLRPDEIFFTDSNLDFTLVAVAPYSEGGVSVERFGRLPLIPVSGKAIAGEWVSIVQHPDGQPKQIAIRASQILSLDPKSVGGINLDSFIHYSTDTDPGSSGSPVLNDQWQVVAIHHKAVPAPVSPGKKPQMPIRWIANEGIRISAIVGRLSQVRFENDHANVVLNRLSGTFGLPPLAEPVVISSMTEHEKGFSPLPESHWNDDTLGYDKNFLSQPIGLDKICAPARSLLLTAPLLNGHGDELRYQHFSVVVHRERRFALITAVNIDGGRLIHPGPRPNCWRQDIRMDAMYQPDDDFYAERRKGQVLPHEKVYFSRGHLVRSIDPCWGEDLAASRRGQIDTFHFTNAAPQFQRYNDADWGNLEDYLLDKAQGTSKRLTVFTGPIFLPDDPYYGRERKGGHGGFRCHSGRSPSYRRTKPRSLRQHSLSDRLST